MNNGITTQFEVMPTAKEAWAKLEGSKLPILLAALIFAVAQMVIQVIEGLFADAMGPMGAAIVASILSLTVLMPMHAGFMYMGLQRVRGVPLAVNQVFYLFKKDLLVQTWLYYIAIYAIVFVGMLITAILLYIPVVNTFAGLLAGLVAAYFFIRISFGIFFIFDKNEKALDALKRSYALTGAYVWKLFLAYLLVIVATILGALPLLIGLIWVIPFTYIYIGLIYQKIAGGTV